MAEADFRFEMRTTVQSGPGCRRLLPGLLEGLGGRRVLLVTDQDLIRVGVAAEVTRLFAGAPGGVELLAVVDDVPQDAHGETVHRVAAEYRTRGADSIVAVGGGSVLDTAKAARWMLGRGVADIEEALTGNRGERWPKARPIGIPFIGIPTTAGTGAEVSPIAVVRNARLGVKTNLLSPFIPPDFALLDAELTVGLPPRITAFTGFDALTHAIEAHFSPRANSLADAYALAAARIIARDLPIVVAHGEDIGARQRMLVASSMAILAFSLALDAIPVHNMAHAFGGRFGIPHGLGNAVLLPSVMDALPDFYLERARGMAEAMGIAGLPEEPGGCRAALVARIRALRREVGLPDTFAEFRLDPAALPTMPECVRRDPARIAYELPAEVVRRVTWEVAGG